MKNSFLLILISLSVVFLFFGLYGCSVGDADTVSVPSQSVPSQEISTEKVPQEDVVGVTSSDTSGSEYAQEVTLLQKQMKPIDKVKLSRAFVKELTSQGSATVAIGVQNKIGRENTFKISLEFRKGLTPSQSNIPLDKTYPQQWVSENVYSADLISGGEKKFYPLTINVGKEIASGQVVVPGTYLFDVVVKDIENGIEHLYDMQTLTVQVIEDKIVENS